MEIYGAGDRPLFRPTEVASKSKARINVCEKQCLIWVSGTHVSFLGHGYRCR